LKISDSVASATVWCLTIASGHLIPVWRFWQGEFAREAGRFEEFHENVFRAFFTDLKDIGRPDVISVFRGSVEMIEVRTKP